MSAFFLTIGTALKWVGFALSPLLILPLLILISPSTFGRPSNALSAGLDRVSSASLTLANGLAILMVLTQILVIIGRYIFDWSASWANETVVYCFAAVFLLAAASALKHDAHVRVDILREKMSARQKAGVDLAGIYLFLFPICILILWASISPSFVRSWANFEGSRETDGLPIKFIFKTLVPLFALLLTVQGLAEAIRAARRIRGHKGGDTPFTQGEEIA